MRIEIKKEILDYWNSKGIVVHKRMTPDIDNEIVRILKYYELDEIKGFIDFYATILEPGVKDRDKKYFWSYKWNLYEFLKRGIRKFDGQETSNYLRKQRVDVPKAVIFTRDNNKK